MKSTCPVCAQAIPSDNINVQTDVALCKACGNIARVSELVDAGFSPATLQDPPPGVWYRQDMRETVISAPPPGTV